MRGPTFALNVLQKSEGSVVLSEKQATVYLENYHKLFPEIRNWHQEIQNTLIKDKRFLRNLFGEPREFNGIWGDNLFKEAYAFIPQSTIGEITNRAIRWLHKHIHNGDLDGYDNLQNGHDAILGQSLLGQEKFCASVMQHYLQPELTNFMGEKFKMKSELQVGFNWSPMKIKKDGSVYNPLGMR